MRPENSWATPALVSKLTQGVTALGQNASPELIECLIAFGQLLLKWNRVYNLTAIHEPQDLITRHLLDSLAVLPWIGEPRTLADIGSGGGLPGIVLSLARPGMTVISIEAVGKKAAFQQQAKIELGLRNFTILNQRIEEKGGRHASGQVFDAIISRAFSNLATFVRLAGPMLAPKGKLFAMKGVLPVDEMAEISAGWGVTSVRALEVPGLQAERHLLTIERVTAKITGFREI